MADDLAEKLRQLELECQRKQNELRESNAQLVQVEKMAALGNLAAGLAHEMNTPVAAIHNNNQVLELAFQKIQQLIRSLPSSEVVAVAPQLNETLAIVGDSLHTNRLACDRIIKFVRSVKNLARLDECDWRRADVRESVENALTLLAHELKGRINVVKEFGDAPEVECYPNQLNQVFVNILLNAAHALDGKGEIRIRTWTENQHVHISISDNGPGIPPETQAKIFDPGFTTKRAGLGTGLGLSISQKIVQAHNGRIELQSAVGRGSTFTIILPLTADRERKWNGNTEPPADHTHPRR